MGCKMRNCLHNLLVALVFALVSATPATAQGGSVLTPFPMGEVQVLLPKAVTVSTRQGPDFTLYYFLTGKADKERQVLFAYVGYAPSFPPDGVPRGIKEQPSKINGKPARMLKWKDKEGKAFCEILVNTGISLAPGTVSLKVHFSYGGLTEAEAKAAEGIIATLRPSAPITKPKAKQ